jgi:hypothetical protein
LTGTADEARSMMTLSVSTLLLLLILSALYALGVFGMRYLEAFRFTIYLILMMFVIVIIVVFEEHPFEGYNITMTGP